MSESKKTPAAKPFAIWNGMTLIEYLKSPEGKERIRKAREEYKRKHTKGK